METGELELNSVYVDCNSNANSSYILYRKKKSRNLKIRCAFSELSWIGAESASKMENIEKNWC